MKGGGVRFSTQRLLSRERCDVTCRERLNHYAIARKSKTKSGVVVENDMNIIFCRGIKVGLKSSPDAA